MIHTIETVAKHNFLSLEIANKVAETSRHVFRDDEQGKLCVNTWTARDFVSEVKEAQGDATDQIRRNEIMKQRHERLFRRHEAEVAAWIRHGVELPEAVYDEFFAYYLDNGDIPYGTAKARTGDPIEWVHGRIVQDIG